MPSPLLENHMYWITNSQSTEMAVYDSEHHVFISIHSGLTFTPQVLHDWELVPAPSWVCN